MKGGGGVIQSVRQGGHQPVDQDEPDVSFDTLAALDAKLQFPLVLFEAAEEPFDGDPIDERLL